MIAGRFGRLSEKSRRLKPSWRWKEHFENFSKKNKKEFHLNNYHFNLQLGGRENVTATSQLTPAPTKSTVPFVFNVSYVCYAERNRQSQGQDRHFEIDFCYRFSQFIVSFPRSQFDSDKTYENKEENRNWNINIGLG